LLASNDRRVVLDAINAMSVPVAVVDVVGPGDFVVFAINRHVERCTGLVNASVAGHMIQYLVPDPAAARVLTNYRKCVETAAPCEYEDEPIGIGQGAGAYTKLEPILDAAGRVVRIVSVSKPRDGNGGGATEGELGAA
jgi:hypothetical protein